MTYSTKRTAMLYVKAALSLFAVWFLIANSIFRFRHQNLTETQLFLNLHRSVLLLEPK